jgi:hypothetical protein
LRLKVVFKNKTRNIKQRHSGERRNPDSATFSWIPDQVRNDVKIRAKALHLKGEGFRPGEWKNKIVSKFYKMRISRLKNGISNIIHPHS